MPWLDLIVPRSASRLPASGEVSEWLKELAWKASGRVKPPRGFESHPLRSGATYNSARGLERLPRGRDPLRLARADRLGRRAGRARCRLDLAGHGPRRLR